MDHRRNWTRWQWVGEPQNSADRRAEVESLADDRQWNLYQWVGQVPGATGRRFDPSSAVDTTGGFSGFGHADSGGQRWATGYRDAGAASVEDDADPGVESESERVA